MGKVPTVTQIEVQQPEMQDPTAVELRLPATVTMVTVARQAFSGLADTFDWTAEFTDDVRLAISEACTNVVQHAYRNVTSPGEMLVSLLYEAGRLLVAVTDQGVGMQSGTSAGGMGLGIPLMRTLADEVELASRSDGTRVQMAFSPKVVRAA